MPFDHQGSQKFLHQVVSTLDSRFSKSSAALPESFPILEACRHSYTTLPAPSLTPEAIKLPQRNRLSFPARSAISLYLPSWEVTQRGKSLPAKTAPTENLGVTLFPHQQFFRFSTVVAIAISYTTYCRYLAEGCHRCQSAFFVVFELCFEPSG